MLRNVSPFSLFIYFPCTLKQIWKSHTQMNESFGRRTSLRDCMSRLDKQTVQT